MRRVFSNEIEILVDRAIVSGVIPDAISLIRLNPLVVGVEPVTGVPDTYVVTDRLRLLGIPFTLRYRARVVLVDEGVDSEVWSHGSTHVVGRIRLVPRGGSTVVRETVELTAPGLLAGYAVRVAQQAHHTMLLQLKERAETRAVDARHAGGGGTGNAR